jgi:hypothetical protein
MSAAMTMWNATIMSAAMTMWDATTAWIARHDPGRDDNVGCHDGVDCAP